MKDKTLRILIGISGGIAAYKIPFLVRLLRKNGAQVKVVLTNAARSLVSEETLRTLSENPVYTDNASAEYDMDHIRLAQWADVFCIAPATANTIAKMAHGIADNLLTSLLLAFSKPVVVAPAMNGAMWRNAATQDNIATLLKRGIRVLPVGHGELACGDEDDGRMLEPQTLCEYILGASLPRCFTGKNILISSGPTAERIDPVRVITNRSTGKMGAALAMAALCMGAEVTVVSGPAPEPLPEGARVRDVVSSADMAQALYEEFPRADVCIMAAAVSDFTPAHFSEKKIKRNESASRQMELIPTHDIAASLAQSKNNQFLVCFALESSDDLSLAISKMEKKQCDMMVFNTVDASLGLDTAAITIIVDGQDPHRFGALSKRECAANILLAIAKQLGYPNE